MRKLIPLIALLICLFTSPVFATDWYACHTGNIDGSSSGATWYSNPGTETLACTCVSPSGQMGTYGTANSPAAGDTLHANGCTTLAVNVDPFSSFTTLSGTVTVTNGSTAVSGSGTSFSTQVAANAWIFFAGQPPLQVASITNNTAMVLTANSNYSYSGTAYNGLVTLSTVTGSGFAGGGLTYGTAAQLTLHAHSTAGTTPCLTISGTQTGAAGTIYGNATGGGTAAAYGISDGHTVGTINLYGNINGGSAASTFGYYLNSAGPINMVGTATGGSGTSAIGIDGTAGGNANMGTITGPGSSPGNACVGGTGSLAAGCQTISSGYFVVIGNIISGSTPIGAQGKIIFQPTASNYVLFANDSSYATGTINTHALEAAPAAAGNTGSSTYLPVGNVLSGNVFGSLTGTYTDPGIANVKLGVNYGAGGTGEQGTYNIPHSYGY